MSSMELLPRPLPDPKQLNKASAKLSRSNSQLAGLPKKMSFLRRLGSRATKNTYVNKLEERKLLPAAAFKGPFEGERGGFFASNDDLHQPPPALLATSPPRRLHGHHLSLPPEVGGGGGGGGGGHFPKINLSGGVAYSEEGRKAVGHQQQMYSSQEMFYGTTTTKVGNTHNNNNSSNNINSNSSKMVGASGNSSGRSGSEPAQDKR